MSREVDVAVIGAGAAGLAAARTLRTNGVSHVLLEARPRAGGRAWTDTETFPGVPFDRGCHWLHSASINPLRAIADELGFAYKRKNSWAERALFRGSREVGADGVAEYGAAVERALDAVHAAGNDGRDIAAADVIDRTDPWHPLVAHLFSLITSGTPAEVSTLDSVRYRQTDEDFPVEAGYGALIAAHARGVAVELSTPVTHVDWSGKGVLVATGRGTIRARAAIVAASTSVLASGGIGFTPGLPDRHAEAIEACRLGCAEKIAFHLDAPLEGMKPGSFLSFMDEDGGTLTPLNCYVNPFGRPLLLAHTGGTTGRELHMAGEAAAIAYGLEVLTKCLGSGIRKRIKGAAATSWVADPFIQGAYSFARPGKADLRLHLAEPIGDRVFLAGEAVSPDFYSTAHGAHLTGIAAAEKAMAVARSN